MFEYSLSSVDLLGQFLSELQSTEDPNFMNPLV